MTRRFLLAFALLVAACPAAGPRARGLPPLPRTPTRIVLVIVDGAGAAHWSAARIFADSLAVLSLPVFGLMEPGNTSRPEPESASSATALATGVRTHYNGVGVGPDSLPRRSVLEAAKAAGLATGVVTTTEVVDATPAAFMAHAPLRADREGIARQIAAADVDVLLGDGRRRFSAAHRADSLDLLAGLAARYAMVEGDPLDRARDPGVRRLAGFFDMDTIMDARLRTPTLPRMTAAALMVLDRNPDGFFLVVESEHTDHLSHRNAPLAVIGAEMIEADRALREILAYRETRPSTLVVVLGDHETGGLSIGWDATAGAWAAHWSVRNHTPALVPVFAVGPGAERFAGFHTNDAIGRILLERVAGDAPVAVNGD